MRILSGLILLACLSGCASAIQAQAHKQMPVQYWRSPDRTELLVTFPDKAEAYYFNNDVKRLCYTYKIKGKWQPSEESALLQSEDGRASVGVLLYSSIDLRHFEGENLVARAVKRITYVYEQRIGRSLADVNADIKLEQFQSPLPGTFKWSARWLVEERDGQRLEARVKKVFAEIIPGWVAQITVSGTKDDDGMARSLLETLRSTSDPECYWPFIREHFPQVH